MHIQSLYFYRLRNSDMIPKVGGIQVEAEEFELIPFVYLRSFYAGIAYKRKLELYQCLELVFFES